MPETYDTQKEGAPKIAYLHYFNGSCDWYIPLRSGLAKKYGKTLP